MSDFIKFSLVISKKLKSQFIRNTGDSVPSSLSIVLSSLKGKAISHFDLLLAYPWLLAYDLLLAR